MSAPRSMGTRTGWAKKLAAGSAAGLSRHQVVQALRVAAIPMEQFEAVVESDSPPTITALARAGTRPGARRGVHRGPRLRAALRAAAALGPDELRELIETTQAWEARS